jgi:hypothetical protein
MQQGLAGTGNASGLVAVVFGEIVPEHGLNPLIGFPGDIG